MQTADSWECEHTTFVFRFRAAEWRLLFQPEMGAIFVVIGDVLREQALQMRLVHGDHMIQQIAAAAFRPSFSDSVLPGALVRSSEPGGQTKRFLMLYDYVASCLNCSGKCGAPRNAAPGAPR